VITFTGISSPGSLVLRLGEVKAGITAFVSGDMKLPSEDAFNDLEV